MEIPLIYEDCLEALEIIVGNIIHPVYPNTIYLEVNERKKILQIHDNLKYETYLIDITGMTQRQIIYEAVKTAYGKQNSTN